MLIMGNWGLGCKAKERREETLQNKIKYVLLPGSEASLFGSRAKFGSTTRIMGNDSEVKSDAHSKV